MAINRRTLRLLAELRRTVGSEADNAVRVLAAAWVKSWNGLASGWQRAVADLIAFAQDLERWPGPAQMARVSTLTQALAATDEQLTALGTLTTATVTTGADVVITASAAAEPGIIGSQMPTALVAEYTQAAAQRILPSALDIIRARTTQAITAQTRPLSAEAQRAMRRELIRGVQLGLNPNEAARRMVAAVNGAFEGGLRRAVLISRTEILDASRAASRYAHRANADVLSGWTWISALDRRTCISCWSRHGTVHGLDEAGPLDHPQGRCARAPRVKPWRELGIDLDEPAADIPDAHTTFANLSRAQQTQIAGARRLAMLNAGQIGWADLSTRRDNDNWRPSYSPTPVRDLERLAARRDSAA